MSARHGRRSRHFAGAALPHARRVAGVSAARRGGGAMARQPPCASAMREAVRQFFQHGCADMRGEAHHECASLQSTDGAICRDDSALLRPPLYVHTRLYRSHPCLLMPR